MKKTLFALIFIVVLSLNGCSASVPQETSVTTSEEPDTSQDSKDNVSDSDDLADIETPTPTPTPAPIPVVTYDEIKSGDYNNQDIYIKCALSNIEYDKTIDYLSFDVWIYNNGNYILDKDWQLFIDDSDVDISDMLNAKEGDLFKIRTTVYEDSSFGMSDIYFAKSLNKSVDIKKIYKQYKESCKTYTCEEILRAPKKYFGTYMKFTGKVFQIISETDDSVEMLLSTKEKNGYVYVQYYIKSNDNRILEGDNITAYGIYYKLYKYQNVLGTSNKIPELFAEFININ